MSLLEILGHHDRSLNALGIGTALAESAIAAHIEVGAGSASGPIRSGHAGRLARAAGVLSGPLPLVLRLFGGRSRVARRAAAMSTLAGAILTRAAWVAAGRTPAGGQAIATNSRRIDESVP